MEPLTTGLDRPRKVLATLRAAFARHSGGSAERGDIAVRSEGAAAVFAGDEDQVCDAIRDMVSDDIALATSSVEPDAPFLERLDALLDVLVTRARLIYGYDDLTMETLALTGLGKPKLQSLLVSSHQRWLSLIKSTLDEGRCRGEFSASIDSEAAAHLIMAAFYGAIMSLRYVQDDPLEMLKRMKYGLLLAISTW